MAITSTDGNPREGTFPAPRPRLRPAGSSSIWIDEWFGSRIADWDRDGKAIGRQINDPGCGSMELSSVFDRAEPGRHFSRYSYPPAHRPNIAESSASATRVELALEQVDGPHRRSCATVRVQVIRKEDRASREAGGSAQMDNIKLHTDG